MKDLPSAIATSEAVVNLRSSMMQDDDKYKCRLKEKKFKKKKTLKKKITQKSYVAKPCEKKRGWRPYRPKQASSPQGSTFMPDLTWHVIAQRERSWPLLSLRETVTQNLHPTLILCNYWEPLGL